MTSADVRSRSSTAADAAADRGAATAITCRVVADAAERERHFAIRELVFVREQGVFAGTDRDDRDDDARTLHVLGFRGALPVGTVRLYPLAEPGLWKGDRLAVVAEHRGVHVGGPLVRFAVRTAAARGGRQMLAYIQPPNVPFFGHLGWHPDGDPLEYCGRPHQRMVIDLGNLRPRG